MTPGRALRVALIVIVAGLPGACREPPPAALSPMQVARNYFDLLRDAEVEEAKGLCAFEDERAEKAWVEQTTDYVHRRAAKHPAWWGHAFRVQVVGDKRSRTPVAFVDVQWRYQVPDGWMMGRHYIYRMKQVRERWRMWITNYDARRGIPFVPRRVEPGDDRHAGRFDGRFRR